MEGKPWLRDTLSSLPWLCKHRGMAGGGVQGQYEGGLGPQSELCLSQTWEGHLESVLPSFVQIMGGKMDPEWDSACSRSHSKSEKNLKLAPKSPNSEVTVSPLHQSCLPLTFVPHCSVAPQETLGLGLLWFPLGSASREAEYFSGPITPRDLTQKAIISLLFPWEKQDFCKLHEPK